jgi:hypothetical protein
MITLEHDRGSRDTIFRLQSGAIARTGAAGTRCFHDIAAQFSEPDVLEPQRAHGLGQRVYRSGKGATVALVSEGFRPAHVS